MPTRPAGAVAPEGRHDGAALSGDGGGGSSSAGGGRSAGGGGGESAPRKASRARQAKSRASVHADAVGSKASSGLGGGGALGAGPLRFFDGDRDRDRDRAAAPAVGFGRFAFGCSLCSRHPKRM